MTELREQPPSSSIAAVLAGLPETSVAAIAGAVVVVTGHVLNLPPTVMAIAGAVLCFGIRLVAKPPSTSSEDD